MEWRFSASLGHSSIEGSGGNNPLGRRGVRVLSKFSRKTNRSCGYSDNPKRWAWGLVSTSVYSRELMRITEMIPASNIQTGLKIKLSAPRTADKWWQENGPCAWDELIQQSKDMHWKKDNLQSIKHRAQIMEAKYFYILAYISMRLITMGLSHR